MRGRLTTKFLRTVLILSPEDEDLRNYCWWHGRYVETKYDGKEIYLHRLILKRMGIIIPDVMVSDHINRNPLDNRRENLRVITQSENCLNKDGVKGISYNKQIKKWVVRVQINGKVNYLGCFKTEEKALRVRMKFLEDRKSPPNV